MKKLIAVAGAIAFALAGSAAFADDAPVTLRLSHWVPPSHPLQPAFEAWAKSIKDESHGSIKHHDFPGATARQGVRPLRHGARRHR